MNNVVQMIDGLENAGWDREDAWVFFATKQLVFANVAHLPLDKAVEALIVYDAYETSKVAFSVNKNQSHRWDKFVRDKKNNSKKQA